MSILTALQRFFRVQGAWKLLAAMLVYGCGTGILNPMNAIYLKDGVHLEKFQISLVVAIALIVNVVITFFSGLWSDNLAHRKILPVVASAVSVFGLIGYDHASGFASAVTFYILSTAPSGAIIGQLYAMARSHLAVEAPDILDIGIVWLRTLLSVGFFIGLYLGTALYTWVTFHGVILGNLVCYATMFFLFLFYRERRGAVAAKRLPQEGVQWVVLIAILLLLCADAIRGLYLPLMVDALFKNPAFVARLWSVQVVFEFIWMTVAGMAARRFGDLRVVCVGAMCALATYCVYAFHPSLPWLFAVQPIYSFFVSVIMVVAMGTIQRMFLSRAGFGSSLYFVLSQSAALIGYLVPNLISGFSPHIFYIPAMLMVVSVALCIGQIYKHSRTGSASASVHEVN